MLPELIKTYINDCKKNDEIRDFGLKTPSDIIRIDSIKYGPFTENLLDVYYPIDTNKCLPTIISIHGGYWVYGDKELYSNYCMRLAQRGFTVVNFTYRLAPVYKYPSPIEDTIFVFKWILSNDECYNIDIKNLFLVGDSIGAQMCVQICELIANKDYSDLLNLQIPTDIQIKACGLNCGLYNISFSEENPPTEKHMLQYYLPDNFSDVCKHFDIFSYLTPNFPPTFLATSEYDMFKDESKPLFECLQANNVPSELHIYGSKERKDVGHVFHVNCRLDAADECNNEECSFFKKYINNQAMKNL